MVERAYTIKEIDQMRRNILATRMSWEAHSNPEYQRQYEQRRDREVEDKLRSYLLAGIDPQELEDEARAKRESWDRIMFLGRLGRWLDGVDSANSPSSCLNHTSSRRSAIQ
jgi:hypothetical protein